MTYSAPKSLFSREIYVQGLTGIKPQTTQYSVLHDQAKSILEKSQLGLASYNYVQGGASSGKTMRNNLSAFDEFSILPKMLNGVQLEDFKTEIKLFGKSISAPLLVCPIGVQAQLHKDADLATSSAVSQIGIPYTHSSAASYPLEEVASKGDFASTGTPLYYQLYWPSDDELTASLLSRAKKAGYQVLVVTLDTWTLGWRPNDLDEAYNPFIKGEGVANLFSDPIFVKKYCNGKSPLSTDSTSDEIFQASLAAISLLTPGNSRKWSDLALLRDLWGSSDSNDKSKNPIVLKGIQTVQDATQALTHGMDGVWVSNHGGRQVDGAIASLLTLEKIAKVCRNWSGGEKTVIFDSGVRTGADVMKALALGAHAVGIGRPWAWGLAVNGEQGVTDVFRGLMADLELNCALAGLKNIHEINRDAIVRNSEISKL